MNTTGLLSLYRSEVNDQEEPYLWSDAEVFAMMDEAQKAFCRKTEGIPDASTPAVTEVAVVPGTSWYPLHPSILRIRVATRRDTGREVETLPQDRMAARGMRFDGTVGPLQAFITGQERNKMRTWPIPNETVTVELTVFRLPLDTLSGLDQEIEIDEEHHRALLLWMKYLSYSKDDAETFDKSKATDNEAKFLRYCESAKTEAQRKRRKPGTVQYGGL